MKTPAKKSRRPAARRPTPAVDMTESLRYRRALALACVLDLSSAAGNQGMRGAELEEALSLARGVVAKLEIQLADCIEAEGAFIDGIAGPLKKFHSLDKLARAAGAPEIDDDPICGVLHEGMLLSSELAHARELAAASHVEKGGAS